MNREKLNTQTILYLVLALAVGLLAGYVLFGGTSDEEVTMADGHTESDHAAEGGAEIWTCSMHPQIQREEAGDCPICGMDLIPLAAGASNEPTVLTMTEGAVALARVRTVAVGDAGAEPGAGNGGAQVVNLTGRLAPDERTTAVQAAHVGGRVERMYVTYAGERVRSGQQIATIYAPTLVVAQEELLQARELAAVNPRLVEAARQKLRNLKVTDAQIDRLESSGEVLTNFPVYAQRGGTVLELKTEVGQYVTAGGALYTLTQLNQLWALFDAFEGDLARIRVGDRVTFTVPSLAADTFRARVTFIDPLIDPGTRTAAVRAEVDNRGGRLKPEMFVQGRIEVSPDKGRRSPGSAPALTVPTTAVLWTGERSVVYVELPGAEVPTYEFREVTLGDRAGDGYRVLSGLAAGERVVVNGVFAIDASAQLNNKASMMNRNVLIKGRVAEAVTALVVPNYRDGTPAAFRAQLTGVASAYLPLKDRMVSTETADEELLAPLRTAIAGVDMSLVKGDAHQYWMQQLEAMNGHLGGLAKAGDVEAQRAQFGFFSQALINALTAFGVNDTLYVQHCPMAYDNEGGNWISAEKEVRNPFFGDKMMTCGYVADELNQPAGGE